MTGVGQHPGAARRPRLGRRQHRRARDRGRPGRRRPRRLARSCSGEAPPPGRRSSRSRGSGVTRVVLATRGDAPDRRHCASLPTRGSSVELVPLASWGAIEPRHRDQLVVEHPASRGCGRRAAALGDAPCAAAPSWTSSTPTGRPRWPVAAAACRHDRDARASTCSSTRRPSSSGSSPAQVAARRGDVCRRASRRWADDRPRARVRAPPSVARRSSRPCGCRRRRGSPERTLATGGYRIESDERRRAAAALVVAGGRAGAALGASWPGGSATSPGGPRCPAYLLFAWLAVALVWIDADVHRLPDGLVLPAYPALLALVVVATAGLGSWRPLVRALVCMAAVFAVLLRHGLVSPSSLGFGDVKLSGLIGLVLGWLERASMVVLGLLAGLPRRRGRRAGHAASAGGSASARTSPTGRPCSWARSSRSRLEFQWVA